MGKWIKAKLAVLFPVENRDNALVAAWRTAKQTVKATLLLGGGGGVVVTAADLATMDWARWGLVAAAALLSAALAAADAWTDVARNGLSARYDTAEAVVSE